MHDDLTIVHLTKISGRNSLLHVILIELMWLGGKN